MFFVCARQVGVLSVETACGGARCNLQIRFTLRGGEDMLGWAVVFLIIALVAAVLGFGGIAAASAGIAKVLFVVFLVLFIISLIFGWRGRRVP
jgi:uncharacterized membrane protein YtjA (UPF0391 family)